ncbi:hypothetical protein OS493_038920 [Desmophyllum pertusum]|uniref:Uncharacterized protein n=1 Tax=Desmophyllum pertusum TaxID=174260 RepID=A0A9X0CHJ2_9CNID|nr:hypothetical protein OS493_038920 [Desmophyllum pertusum]
MDVSAITNIDQRNHRRSSECMAAYKALESKNEDSDDIDYVRAFAALDELKLARLKPFFKEQFLQDDTLCFMNSEEELRNFLIKAFKFSRFWFSKYHKRAETLDAPGFETPQSKKMYNLEKLQSPRTWRNKKRRKVVHLT